MTRLDQIGLDTPQKRIGGLLAAVAAGLAIALAFFGSQKSPPSASSQGLIAFLAVLAQLGSAYAFSRDGKADPSLAQRSVARLLSRGRRANNARRLAEDLAEGSTRSQDLKAGLGQLSVHLSYLEEGFIEAIDDWRTFHPHAVQEAEERQDPDDE